jgi:hypothetical protein
MMAKNFIINIEGDIDFFCENLDAIADDSPYRNDFIDTTIANKSSPRFIKKDNGDYSLSYTRPLFGRTFKSHVSDFKYDFRVFESNSIVIEGKIKLKPFVILVLVAFLSISVFTLFAFPKKDISGWWFYILASVFLPFYFFTQRKRFEKEVRNFITGLAKNKSNLEYEKTI